MSTGAKIGGVVVELTPHASSPKRVLEPCEGKLFRVSDSLSLSFFLSFPLSHPRDHGRVDVSRVVATVKVSEGEYSDSFVGGSQRGGKRWIE